MFRPSSCPPVPVPAPLLPARAPAATRLAGLLLACAAALPGAAAAQAWQASDDVVSFLGAASAEDWSDAALRYTATFADRTVDHLGAQARPVGLYIAWLWTYDSLGQSTALAWDDASGRFVGAGVSATLARLDAPMARLALTDLAGLGADQARSPGFGETPIQAQAGWQVPLVDVGSVVPGGSATYGLSLTLAFDDQGAFQDWLAGGSYHVEMQGLVGALPAVPEPATAALALAGLLTLALRRGVPTRSTGRRTGARPSGPHTA